MGPKGWLRRSIAASCLHLLFAASAFAQSDSAVVLGAARDSQRALVSGVIVSARNIDTGFTRDTTTDDEGRYRLTAVPPGRYELTAARTGFRTVVRAGVVLTIGAESVIDFELPVGGI